MFTLSMEFVFCCSKAGYCQHETRCHGIYWTLAIQPHRIQFRSAISKPAMRSSYSQLCFNLGCCVKIVQKTVSRHWLETQCLFHTMRNIKNTLLHTPNLRSYKSLYLINYLLPSLLKNPRVGGSIPPPGTTS